MLDKNLDKISTQKCLIFNEIVRKGAVSLAARSLHIPAFKLHNDLNSLEKTLKTALIVRNQKKLMLTEAGKKFADFSRTVADGLQYLEGDIKEKQEDLVIATYYGLAEDFLPAVIAEFHQLHPHVRVHILAGVEYLDFTENDLDAAIAAPLPNRVDLSHTYLMTSSQYLFASPTYVEKFGMPQTFSDFRRHRLLIFKGMQYTPRDIFEVNDPIIETTSVGLLYELTKLGLGIAPLPIVRLQKDDLCDRKLVHVLKGLKCHEIRASFITRRFSRKTSLTDNFLKILKQYLDKRQEDVI